MGKKRVIIIGGGAAGIFAAAQCKDCEVIVLEKTRQLLSKVRISGGGRCNVTHSEFDPKKLTHHYPRGHRELLGPFHHFQPKDTIAWFEGQGVALKREEDGRMFPTTDHSETIIACLLNAAKHADIRSEHGVSKIEKKEEGFTVHLEKGDTLECDYLILATGSHPKGHALAASLGHTIVPPVPSLFTFNIPTSPLLDLAGIVAENVELILGEFKQRGDLLLTHWGFSGPAALKLSAWAARSLHACDYRTTLTVNWTNDVHLLDQLKQQKPFRTLEAENPFHLPMNLWKRLIALADIPANLPLGHVPNKAFSKLIRSEYAIEGKTTYKQEFVTCGGVDLKEIDFRTMESRMAANLFFTGEVLNIDGVTGGFNFQNAWTTAFLAGSAINSKKQ